MEEMMTAVINDLNGDGVLDIKDRFGYLTSPHGVLPNFWISAGELTVKKDENDMPYPAVGDERFLTVFDKIFDMMGQSGMVCFDLGGIPLEQDHNMFLMYAGMFENNQGLFMHTTLYRIEFLRGLNVDFGILPYPKFDEQQENYVSRMEYFFAQQVPVTNTDLERAGVMLEALNSESAKTIFPAFYEIALKTKYVRDDSSAEMLDLITKSLVIDIGDTTHTHIFRDKMGGMFADNDRNLVSKIRNMEGMFKAFTKEVEKRLPKE
jgi:hypothetical protein